jgi:hypothetical protein
MEKEICQPENGSGVNRTKQGLGRGFKSHPVHFFLLWKYGIKSGLF